MSRHEFRGGVCSDTAKNETMFIASVAVPDQATAYGERIRQRRRATPAIQTLEIPLTQGEFQPTRARGVE